MENTIRAMVQKYYKSANLKEVSVQGDFVSINIEMKSSRHYALFAKRILDCDKDLNFVRFYGGFTESVYTRETLKCMEPMSKIQKPYGKCDFSIDNCEDCGKLFTCGESELCRADLESMDKTYIADGLTDKDMQSIVDEWENSILKERVLRDSGKMSEAEYSKAYWDKLSDILERRKVPFVED